MTIKRHTAQELIDMATDIADNEYNMNMLLEAQIWSNLAVAQSIQELKDEISGTARHKQETQ